jgi:hypothetical protein
MDTRTLGTIRFSTALCLCLFWGIASSEIVRHDWGSFSQGEYCDYENFMAQCAVGQSIYIVRALYGHMALGKCVKVEGYLGCQTDVSALLASKCNRNVQCEVNVLDAELRKTQPCEVGVSVYLDAAYVCISGEVLLFYCQRKFNLFRYFVDQTVARITDNRICTGIDFET